MERSEGGVLLLVELKKLGVLSLWTMRFDVQKNTQ